MTCLFHVRAAADPQTLPRILGMFSQRWVMPSRVAVRRSGSELVIACKVPGLSREAGLVIAAKLEESVLVAGIRLSFLPEAPAPP